ncbi:MAG TPA: hypothetical protein VGF36_09000, partial [Rhodopila sp.]
MSLEAVGREVHVEAGRSAEIREDTMDLAQFRATVGQDAPPDGLDLALQTLWWDAKGDWNHAHACAQQDEGQAGSAVHAYLHRKEGDMRNAAGWYARAGRQPATVPLEQEWQSLAEEMMTHRAAQDARAAMDGFMAAFNARDAEAIRSRWFHFPHVRFHSGTVTVMQTPAEYGNLVWDSQTQSRGWDRSAWDTVEVIDAGPEKVHFRVQFTRYRADGSVIGNYRSLYIVTLRDGRWAIQGRSS